jgi:formate/nitrite transporter FocA (FNT family)
LSRKEGKSLWEAVEAFIKNQVANAIAKGLKKYVSTLIKTFLKAMIGGLLAGIGLLFIWIGIVDYLSIYFPKWSSYVLTGVISLVIGFIVIMLAIPRK